MQTRFLQVYRMGIPYVRWVWRKGVDRKAPGVGSCI